MYYRDLYQALNMLSLSTFVDYQIFSHDSL